MHVASTTAMEIKETEGRMCGFLEMGLMKNPTDHFTIFEPHDQEIGDFFLVQERLTTDHEAPIL